MALGFTGRYFYRIFVHVTPMLHMSKSVSAPSCLTFLLNLKGGIVFSVCCSNSLYSAGKPLDIITLM